ncbi:MAG: hypothetical protein N838_27820 [Thiohalocapsa sp. PB-PSB1]|nr:MAG: hypothetical protein N838_27820 [Thiohalocapsa sp. PB-PSB1]
MVCVGDDPGALTGILQPETGIAILRRFPAAAIVREVEKLGAGALPGNKVRLDRDSSGTDIAGLLAAHDLDPAGFQAWIDDIAALAGVFFTLTARLSSPPPTVTLRIESLADDGCRRFHTDRSQLRLLCTYRGPGTEWLVHDQVDWQALETHQPNEAILRHGQPRHLEPFWVGVLKGECFPGNAGRGLVHRSPPVAGTGMTRVLVCLDA